MRTFAETTRVACIILVLAGLGALGMEGSPAPAPPEVASETALSAGQREMLGWHFRNAERLSVVFAKREGLVVFGAGLPSRVELFRSPEGVARATGRPRWEELGEAVARINLARGIVYLGRKDPEDLYVELGKWFFYDPRTRWGMDPEEDARRLALAEKFARYCLDEKNWTEAGGSRKALR
jgi:hypothetical protein